MNFPASTNAGAAQSGPNYGCLGSQPNPAWFFMQMATTGSMSIAMSAANDIDFICWGPFSTLSGACNSLTAGNIQDCSYSGSATETCTIANAVPGQFYVLLITNFSNSSQNITFNQINPGNAGTANTNCGFVCVVTPTTSGMICAGQSVTLSLAASTSSSINSYTWSGPGSFSSNLSTNVLSNVTSGGTYTVRASSNATLNGTPYTGTCQAAVTVSVMQYPTFSVTPTTTTICQGGNFQPQVTFTPSPVNVNNYFFSWNPSGNAGIGANSVLLGPFSLPTSVTVSTLIYSVTVAPLSNAVTCAVTKTLAVTINNPLTPTITAPAPMCDSFNPVQLTAAPGGGTWSANPAVGPGGLFNPALAAIGTSSVTYGVSSGTCIVYNSQTVAVSRYYSPALTSTPSLICVQDPVMNLMNIVQNTLTGSWSGIQITNRKFFTPTGLATGNYLLKYRTTSLPDSTVCPDSTTLVAPVFNPPVPVIGPIPPLCDNAATVALTANPSLNGVWSGNLGVSPQGIQTPSLNVIGTNTVTYSSGQGTCVASSSKTFHVSHFNPATLTGTIAHLCFNSSTVNLMSIVQNTNGSWSGFSVNGNNVFNPSGLPTNTYNLHYHTISFPNTNLCMDSSRISVSVLNPPTPTITQAGPFCNTGPAVQLSVTPATGHWINSSYLSGTGVFTPSLSGVGGNVVNYVTGTSTCFVQQSKIINTEAFVSAAITSGIADQCNSGASINLSPYTVSGSGTWVGPGIQGSNFNPGNSGAGTFTLTYQTASFPSGLCPDNATVSVRVFSLAAPAITNVGPLCTNAQPVQLQVSPLGGIFASGTSGLITPSGLFDPSRAGIGDNFITYSISAGPCIANAQIKIPVEKFISAAFGNQGALAYCKNAQAFNLDGLAQNPGGIWAGSGVTGLNMFDPSKANIGDNLIVYQTHSSPSTLLCPDQSTVIIKVKNVPVINAVSNVNSGCAPLAVTFSASSNSNGLSSWNLGDGEVPKTDMNFNHVFNNPGTYTVVFNFSDGEALGCSVQTVLSTPIIVHEQPKADFRVEPEEITIANSDITLTNLSSNIHNNYYQWTITGLNQVSEISPTINLPAIGRYEITLSASTIYGCKDAIKKTVEVKNDFHVFIPNSFTPNADGTNDVFFPVFSPYGLDYKTYSMEIYDRWGHEVFRSTDVTKGWNGGIQNKEDVFAKEDSYVYKLKYKDLDGRVYSKTGYVVLLR